VGFNPLSLPKLLREMRIPCKSLGNDKISTHG